MPDENQIGKRQRPPEKSLRPLSNICQATRGTFVVGESRKRSGGEPIPRTVARPFPGVYIVRPSFSLSFQTASDEYSRSDTRKFAARVIHARRRERERSAGISSDSSKFTADIPVNHELSEGFRDSTICPGIDASRLLRSLHTKCRSPKVSVLWNARL